MTSSSLPYVLYSLTNRGPLVWMESHVQEVMFEVLGENSMVIVAINSKNHHTTQKETVFLDLGV